MTPAAERLARRLGYTFRQPEILADALTHRSAGSHNNERLEFLGDAILNFVIAAELFAGSPHATEGELSRLRATLVNRTSLADIARDLELGDCLTLGAGELKSGGFRRASILSDALEAVFGAVYLDGGFEPCRALVLALYRERLASLPGMHELKDPKTRLQELLQARHLPLPTYRVVEVSGAPHAQTFLVDCEVRGLTAVAHGRGNSRRTAEQAAAQSLLEQLGGGAAGATT